MIAVAGGDGTINEVVNGLAAARRGRRRRWRSCRSARRTCWRTNSASASKAAALARTITSGRAVLVQPGRRRRRGDPRCFSLMAGAGFDAKVVAGVSAPLKRRFGKAAYVWRSLIETRRYRPVRYAVEIDGAPYEAASVIVTRSRHYAGPYVVAPERRAQRAAAACLPVRALGPPQTLRFGLALLLGRLPLTGGYRVITGRQIKVSVLSDAGETAPPAGADRR